MHVQGDMGCWDVQMYVHMSTNLLVCMLACVHVHLCADLSMCVYTYISSGAVVVECDDSGCLWWRLQHQLASNKLKQTDIARRSTFGGPHCFITSITCWWLSHLYK